MLIMAQARFKDKVFHADGGDITLKTTDTSLEKTDTTSIKDHANKTKPTLPPDVLAKIFEHLVPERPTATTHRKPPYEKSANSAKYRDLTNVSRASRQFHVLAKPLLLKSVALPDWRHMCRFMRTLGWNPEERKHIKHLSFEFPVNDETKLFALAPMWLQEARKAVRALSERQSFKDVLLSILHVDEGRSQHGGASVPLWTSIFVLILSMCSRLESLEIRLLTPWTTWHRNHDVGNRILWDFLLRVGRLPVEDTGPDSSQLVEDDPPSSWPPPYLRKVTVIFNEPQLPYDRAPSPGEPLPVYWELCQDKRIEIDVVPNSDRWAHARIMGEMETIAGTSSILQNYSTYNIPDPRMLLKRPLEEPKLIPHLSADEYLVFMFYLDRLKNIPFIKDMNFEEHIDSLQRLLQLPVNAKKGGGIGDLDLAKHVEFLRAYDLLVALPHPSESLRMSALHGHLQLFEFLDVASLTQLDEYRYFERQVDPLKMRSLSLTHTRKQSDETERFIHLNITDQGQRRLFHDVDDVLYDYSELRALHLPLFLSHKLSQQIYPRWELSLMNTWEEDDEDQGWQSLRDLKMLKELTITFSGLAGQDEAAASLECLVEFFRDDLPPSLETLNLLEWWPWYFNFYISTAEDSENDTIGRRNVMLKFLENLAEAIVYARPASLKKIEISYLEEPGMFSDLFHTLKERPWQWKIVDRFLGIELVVKSYQCGREHFGPRPEHVDASLHPIIPTTRLG